jgi:hypothetical protein
MVIYVNHTKEELTWSSRQKKKKRTSHGHLGKKMIKSTSHGHLGKK